jgi:hypothetical protein
VVARAQLPAASESCATERPLTGVGDHHPDNLDLPPAGAYCPRFRGYETVADEESQQLGLEAMRQHDRFGAAKAVAGEQPERSALVGADAPFHVLLHAHQALPLRANDVAHRPPSSGLHAWISVFAIEFSYDFY